MIINPERIAFESKNDVIDYVSKGMIPTRKNFEKVMFAVRCPTPNLANVAEGQVDISVRVFMDCDNKMMEEILQQVYKNRVRNRNITLGVLGTIGVVAAALLLKGSSNKNTKDEFDDCSNCPLLDIDFD